jgi:glycine reductase
MKLKLGRINIKDIQFGELTKIESGVLYVNKEQILAAVADERLSSIDLDLARPGESVRIMPVKDVIEPRLKLEGSGGIFPGFISKVDMV